MATDNVVRLITIRGKAEGLDELVGKMKQLVDAQGNVVSVSEKQSKATSDLDKMAERYQRRLVDGYAQTQQFNKVQSDLTMLRNAGRISGEQYGAMLDKEAIRLGQTSALSNAFRQSLGGVQMQMVALSAGAGPVGVFLSALGRWGLAGAVGLGALEKTFGMASAMAHEFAQKARELKDFAESTGLTISQLKALDHVGVSVGVSSERVAQGIEGMTSRLEEFRNAQGKGFDLLNKYNSGLAIELASARDTASAINILSKAFANLDTTQSNALGRALGFGRAPGDMIRMLNAVGSQGGMGGIAGLGPSIDENLAQRISKLDIEIVASTKRMKNSFVSVFAEDVLSAEKQFLDYLTGILDRMKQIGDQQGFWSKLAAGASSLAPVLMPGVTGAGAGGRAIGNMITGPQPLQLSPLGLGSVRSSVYGDLGKGRTLYDEPIGPQQPKPSLNAEAQFNILQRWMSLLGPAATSAEHLTEQQAKLSAENEKLGNRYGSLVDRAMEYNRVQSAGADLQIRVQIGVATADAMRSQKLAELDLQLKKINATDAERTKALAQAGVAIQKDIELTQQQMAVRGAALPGLKQMELESGSLRTQLDQLSTTSLNNMTTALTDMAMGTVTAADGFRNLGLQVVRSIEEMIIKMTIAKPIADALNTSVGSGGILSFLGIGGVTGPATGSPAGLPVQAHSGGILGVDSFPGRYVHPAYFDVAPRFGYGGIVGADEVPIVAHKGEGVFTPGQMAAMGGGGPTINATYNIDASGSSMTPQQFQAIIEANNRRLLKQIDAAAPGRQTRYQMLGT